MQRRAGRYRSNFSRKRPNRPGQSSRFGGRTYSSSGRSRFSSGRRGKPSFSRGRGRGQRSFDPSVLVKEAVRQKPVQQYAPKHKFADFPLSNQLKKNILAKGYETPTQIQDEVIPLLIESRDVIGMARTGTGKTAAFLIPLINKIYNNKSEKVLIITPTRELAIQIEAEFRGLAQQMGLFSVVCIGGVSIRRQISQLRRNPNFVIGTPGRLKDLEERRMLSFRDYASIVLDEVDRMLDMGFMPDVRHIVSRLSKQRQSLFFSATVPDKMRDVIGSFLNNPVSVSIKSTSVPTNVDQDVIRINGKSKIDVLHDLLIKDGFDKVLVFIRTKRAIERLVKELRDRGFQVSSIHGNKSQHQRQRALEEFKRNRIKVLLATDVASRGLDIDDVTHVINYDLPESYENYIHRIGRTGRMDKKGTALTFV